MTDNERVEEQNTNSENTEANETGEDKSSQAVGLLLGKAGLIIIAIGIFLAAWGGHTAIVILLGLVLASAGLARLWSRLSLHGVSCERILSGRRVFPGETVEVTLRLNNRKLLPLPWITVDDEIPLGVASNLTLTPGSKSGTGILSKTASLLWYTGIHWHHDLDCSRRGYYELGPAKVTSGDIFGFYPRSQDMQLTDHIIVYPRIFPISQIGIPSLYPLGETKAEQRIFEDQTRTIGVRDYTAHDSLKRIHWKASARHQCLQVRVFEPTTTLKVALFLAVDSFEYCEDGQDDDFELGISMAASIANYIIEQGSPAGVFVNTCKADSGQSVVLPPSGSHGQLMNILEELAKVTSSVSVPVEEFLQSELKDLPWGTTLVLITSKHTESMSGVLADLKESRRKMVVIQVSDGVAEGVDFNITGLDLERQAKATKVSVDGV